MSARTNTFQQEATAAAGGFSLPIVLPRRLRDTTVRAVPGAGGTATIYFTLDDAVAVLAEPDNAKWDAWEDGAVASRTIRALAGPVTALRIGAATQPAVLQVVSTIDY